MASAVMSRPPTGTSGRAGSSEASTTPAAMTMSISPAVSPIVSPRATAITAAIAPSVATIGATTDTLPIATAAYVRLRPAT